MPFIEPQSLFEQSEISIAETFSCLATVLPDFLFLQGAPYPGGSILPFELLQFKQVFLQHCFPLKQRRHRFSFLVSPERIPAWWMHMLHVPVHDKAPHITCSVRQASHRQQEDPNSCWSLWVSEASLHRAFLSSFLTIRLRRMSYETILVMYTKGCYNFLLMTEHKRLAGAPDENTGTETLMSSISKPGSTPRYSMTLHECQCKMYNPLLRFRQGSVIHT